MLRVFIIFALFTSLWGKSLLQKPSSQIGEISADKLMSKGNQVIANGNVVLVSGEYYLQANDLVYDKKSKLAEASGEVRVYHGENLMLSASKVKIDFSQDELSLSSLYMQNTQTDLWVSAAEASSDQGVYYFKKSVVSGCDIQSPIWHLDSSSGSLDNNTNILTLWNTRVYLGKMPFLYIPYLSVSTYNERKSGLLYPNFALLDQDGIYYQQPIFIAPYESWDITLSPQIRTLRGVGLSGEFRLATPRDNLFAFQSRYFYNFNSYVNKYLAKHQHIYGGSLFFSTTSGTGAFDSVSNVSDGFYANILLMNDLDYLRLDDASAKITERINTSTINYFLQSQDHYLGIYNKYFFDLSKSDNYDTFQVLPSVQYHKYIDSLFWKNLMYSIDFQTNNAARTKGYNYVENSIALPVGVEIPLFDNYLSIGLSTDLYFSNINFYNAQDMRVPISANQDLAQTQKNANFFTANYSASVTTDLARDYGKFLHAMQFSAGFSGPYYTYSSHLFDRKIYIAYANRVGQYGENVIRNLWNPLSIVDFDSAKHGVDLKMSQYFYARDGRTLFYYNASQKLNLEDKDFLFSSSMQNEIGSTPIWGLDLKGTLSYSFLYQDIEEASAKMDFSRWSLKSSFGYYYKQQFFNDKTSIDANFLNFELQNDFGYFALKGDMNYDFLNTQVKDWSIAISTDIRCFGVTLKFAQEFVPFQVDRPDRPIELVTNNYVKLEFRVVPLGAVGGSYRFQR